MGELGPGTVIAGQIDRLVVTPSEVLVVDYKTNRPAPRTALETPQPYLRQMAAYRMALGKIYLGKSIRCALLWTEEPRLMALPEGLSGPIRLDRPSPGPYLFSHASRRPTGRRNSRQGTGMMSSPTAVADKTRR